MAAASWPVTATEVSNSLAMSTNSGPNIKATVLFKNNATAIIEKARTWVDVEGIEVSVVITCG